jgi:hypothetical protein
MAIVGQRPVQVLAVERSELALHPQPRPRDGVLLGQFAQRFADARLMIML